MIDPVWDHIHASRGWLTYPNQEMTKWVQFHYLLSTKETRKPNEIRILDLGCGQGASTIFLANCGFDTVAIDGSLSAIVKMKQNLQFHGFSVETVCCDMKSIPYPDEHFDAVIDIVSICHNTNYKDIYNEVFRVLKPGGGLFSAVPAQDTSRDIWEPYGVAVFFSQKMIEEALSEKFLVELSYKTVISFSHNKRLSHWIIESQKKPNGTGA
jgi:ubiquinone/menaquinone biosynthesis C-methylase UbiE